MTPRYLHFAPLPPWPSGNGLAMRCALFAEALARHGGVDVLVPGAEAASAWPGQADIRIRPLGAAPDTPLRLIRALRDPVARAVALRGHGRPWASVLLSTPVLSAARERVVAGDWRGLVISRAYLLPLLDQLPPAAAGLPVLVDLDDDDAGLCRARAVQLRAAGKADEALWLEAEADAFEALIARHAARVARFTAASAAVADELGARLGLPTVTCVPNAVAVPDAPRRDPVPGRLVFVGNLRYAPNAEGLTWFIAEVWPRLRAAHGDVELVVAGSGPDRALRAACATPGVTLIADPPALDDIYAGAAAAVVPLRAGSGSRIKILEAAAHGVPVVATATGLAGIDADPVRHLFGAPDEPEALAETCLAVLGAPEEAARRSAAFRDFVATRHERGAVIAALAETLREVMP